MTALRRLNDDVHGVVQAEPRCSQWGEEKQEKMQATKCGVQVFDSGVCFQDGLNKSNPDTICDFRQSFVNDHNIINVLPIGTPGENQRSQRHGMFILKTDL